MEPAQKESNLPVERRKDGWTMGREIIGTIIGAAAVALPLCVALITWGAKLETQTAINAAEIAHLRETRSEILIKMEKISEQVANIDRNVARALGGPFK